MPHALVGFNLAAKAVESQEGLTMTKPKQFAGLSEEHCRTAWGITRAAFEAAHGLGILNKHAGTVVVLRPDGVDVADIQPSQCVMNMLGPVWDLYGAELGLGELEITEVAKSVLFIDHIGEEADPKYTGIALKKALLAQRAEMPTGDVHHTAPWLMQPGDILFQGGVTENGLTVGFSGVQSPWDECFSWTMISTVQAELRMEMAEARAGDNWVVPLPS